MPQVTTRALTSTMTDRFSVSSGKGTLLATMCLAVLLAQVDTSVVNLAIRSIGQSLEAGVTGLQWVLDGYNLAYALLLLTGGLLSDLYGRRLLFLLGAAIFTVGSVVCAAAPDIGLLIGGRAIAGVGAAVLLPASLSIIRVEWKDKQSRNRALGVWAACNGLAFVIGPTIGGALVDTLGWRSVFLIAVPLGAAAIALALRVVPESSDPSGRHLDASGQIWGAVAVAGLALAGIEVARDRIVAAIALAVAIGGFLLFLRTEQRRGSAAMVPLDLFQARRFVGALTATSVMTFGMYGVLFLVPLFWQASGSVRAGMAGLALVPMAAVFFVLSNMSGRLAEQIGERSMIGGGTALVGIGLLVIAATASGTVWAMQAGLVLTGLGMGLNTGPLFGVAVGSVPAERSGSAASLINVARMIGATLGVAVLGTAFAMAGSGTAGLRVAMLVGGIVQIAGASAAWLALRQR
jgi:MFS transporter, DHA2 family, methylenomycin A resistance protein